MESEQVLKLISMIRKLKDHGKKISSQLELDKCERLARRLDSFSKDCKFCQRLFDELEAQILQLIEKDGVLNKQDFKSHRLELNRIIKHLEEQHKLIAEGHYLSIYMTLGMGVGLLYDITILDHIGMGISLGMLFGVVVGSTLDTNAKKKNMTI